MKTNWNRIRLMCNPSKRETNDFVNNSNRDIPGYLMLCCQEPVFETGSLHNTTIAQSAQLFDKGVQKTESHSKPVSAERSN